MGERQKKRANSGYLSTPLTRDEQLAFDHLYRQHLPLVRHMGRKLSRKYSAVERDDIYSCVNLAFLRACRAWDPSRGKFSTIFGIFCESAVTHFIRDNNWSIKAPGGVRTIGFKVKYMLRDGASMEEVCEALNITQEKARDALFSVQSLDHEIKDFALHLCPRPTPWELLEAQDI